METLNGKDQQETQGLLTRSITRRQAIKAGGIAVVGLAFSKPLIETVMPKPAFANYVTTGGGCTPGYWRQPQHFDSWTEAGYNPAALFSLVFGRVIQVNSTGGNAGPPSLINGPTLLEAVWAAGGNINALARSAVAALLNAAHPDVNYAYTEAEVIEMVQKAIDGDADVEDTKDELDRENNRGCTLS